MTRLPLLLTLAVLLGCSDNAPTSADPPDAAPSYRLSVTSGNGQIALQGAAFEFPVTVKVTDDGSPAPGVTVQATVTGGGGSVSESTQTTDADGRASFSWQAGLDYNQSLTFSVGNATTLASGVTTYHYFPPPDVGDGWPLRALDPAVADPTFELVDEIRRGRWQKIHSLLIAHQGEFLLETYFPGQTSTGQQVNWNRATPHEVQSTSKSFRSSFIGLAIDRGLIRSVEEPLTTFFPDFSSELTGRKAEITLEHVLTMSTGLQWDETGAAQGNSDNSLSKMYATPQSNWTRYVLSLPIQYTPGSSWVYNTGASLMLADILTRGTGTSGSEFVRDNMEQPMQMSTVTGHRILPRDMLKLGQLFLDGGTWQGARIISEDWVNESLTERFTFSNGQAYGYQWWMRTVSTNSRNYRIQYASGNGGQFIILVPDLDLVVVSTGGNFGSGLMNQIWTMLEEGILPVFE